MEFNNVFALFKAVNAGKITKNDHIRFNLEKRVFYTQGRFVKKIHGLFCFLADKIPNTLKFRAINNYLARHKDANSVLEHNIESQKLKHELQLNLRDDKLTGDCLKQMLENSGNNEVQSLKNRKISIPPDMLKTLPSSITGGVLYNKKRDVASVIPSEVGTISDTEVSDAFVNSAGMQESSLELLNKLKDSTQTAENIKEFLASFNDDQKKLLFKSRDGTPYSYVLAALSRAHYTSNVNNIEEVKKIISVLIENNAPFSGINEDRLGIISHIIQMKYPEDVIEHVIDSVDVSILNQQTDERTTALLSAIQQDKYDIASKLIERVKVNEFAKHSSETPLFAAIKNKQRKLVEELISKGANVNCHDGIGDTPIITAVNKNDKQIVRLLIEAGADATKKDRNGKTAIQHAEGLQQFESLKILRRS